MFTSYIQDLSNEQISEIFNDCNVEIECDLDIYDLRYRKTGSGHWELSVELRKGYDSLDLTITTTDSMLIDSWNEDEDWFQENDWYENNSEVMKSALSSIIRNESNQEDLYQWLEDLKENE